MQPAVKNDSRSLANSSSFPLRETRESPAERGTEPGDERERLNRTTQAASSGPVVARMAWVDGLRGLLAVLVFMSHVVRHYRKVGISPVYDWVAAPLLGYCAVPVFILVSGFCLMYPIARDGRLVGGWRKFFERRGWRVLPGYYACLVGVIVLSRLGPLSWPTGTLWEGTQPVTNVQILVHALLLQDFYGSHKINYPMWSIPVEAHLYLLFPALVWLWMRARSVWAVMGTAVLSVVAVGVSGTAAVLRLPVAWDFVALFTMGMGVAAGCQNERCREVVGRMWWGLLALPAGAAGWAYFAAIPVERQWVVDLVFGAGAAAIMLFVAVRPECWAGRMLSKRVMVWLGAFSYSLYLVHAPVTQLVYLFLVRPWVRETNAVTGVLMVLAPIVVIPAAWGFHVLFERPYLRGRWRATARARFATGAA